MDPSAVGIDSQGRRRDSRHPSRWPGFHTYLDGADRRDAEQKAQDAAHNRAHVIDQHCWCRHHGAAVGRSRGPAALGLWLYWLGPGIPSPSAAIRLHVAQEAAAAAAAAAVGLFSSAAAGSDTVHRATSPLLNVVVVGWMVGRLMSRCGKAGTFNLANYGPPAVDSVGLLPSSQHRRSTTSHQARSGPI